LLPAIPVALCTTVFGMEEPYAGWSRWSYLLFFLYGFVLAADDRFRTAMRRDAVPAAVLGVVLFGFSGAALAAAGGDPFTDMTVLAVVSRLLFGLAGWCWLVAILGLLDRPARRPAPGPASGSRRRWLAYLGAAALPLYILHQPILVAVAYFVVRWPVPAPVKYLAIVAATFAIMFAVYDLGIRRTRITRLLFGMRDQATGPPG